MVKEPMRLHNKKLTPTARMLRKNMTPQEKRLWYQFFRNYPIRVYRQRVIGRFVVDFYCSNAKLVIEIDGSQHFEPAEMVKDKERTEYIESFGLKVLRFNNADVTYNFAGVCTAIDEEITKRIKINGGETP